MDPIAVTVPLAQVETVMLASVRVAGFLVIAPPFSARGIPGTVRVVLAMAIGTAVAPRLESQAADTGLGFVVSLAVQVTVGLALGFVVQLLVSALQAAGALVDQFGGFSMGQAYDPLNQTLSAQMAQFYGYLAVALLFASDGYQIVLAGLVRTFDVIPISGGIDSGSLGETLTTGITQMVVGSLQISGPLIVVLFLTDIGLGLLTKVAPALNAFAMGFPLKILITLIMVGFTLLAMPEVVRGLALDGVDALSGVRPE